MQSVAPWAEWDEAKTVDATVEIAVQINGKVRTVINISADASNEECIAAARANEKVLQYLEGKTTVKEICVPQKLVNIVVK